MAEQKRRLAVTKKVSLSDIAEGWDDCYAIVTKADYATFQLMRNTEVETMSQSEQMKLELQVITDHFVAGKVRILGQSGESVLADMELSDVEGSIELINKLYLEIMGVTLDPKDLSTLMTTSPTNDPSTPPSSDTKPTTTT